MGFSRQNTGVSSHFFLQGIFLTLVLNPRRLHCRKILHHLSHQGSPQKPPEEAESRALCPWHLGCLGNESVIPGGAHGQHTTASPTKENPRFLEQASLIPTKLKSREGVKRQWGQGGLPVSSRQPESLGRRGVPPSSQGCPEASGKFQVSRPFLLPTSSLQPF